MRARAVDVGEFETVFKFYFKKACTALLMRTARSVGAPAADAPHKKMQRPVRASSALHAHTRRARTHALTYTRTSKHDKQGAYHAHTQTHAHTHARTRTHTHAHTPAAAAPLSAGLRVRHACGLRVQPRAPRVDEQVAGTPGSLSSLGTPGILGTHGSLINQGSLGTPGILITQDSLGNQGSLGTPGILCTR